ncbi:MAG: hypothetical protein QW655_07065 [Nitrososphaerota archaeon]|nr:hypothetical protein [Candidatus Geocrenenecus dongiae]
MKDEVERAVEIEEIQTSRNLLEQLAYPSRNIDYATRILNEFKNLGISMIYVTSNKEPLLKILGKGYRGIVLKVVYRDGIAVAKVMRIDSGIESLSREANMLELANKIGIGPRLYSKSNHVIVLEYIEGQEFEEWIDKISLEDIDILKKVLREVFLQAYKLDSINLDHGELNDLREHVIVKSDLTPVIIDFGKASLNRKPKNVTSVFSYITHGPQSRKIMSMLEIEEPPINTVKEYKVKRSEESFKKLLKSLNLG